MDFMQFVAALDTPDGKAFEDRIAHAAIEGNWALVEKLVIALVYGFPDVDLRDMLLIAPHEIIITAETWPDLQRAVLQRSPTHIDFQIDGNALYDVLNGDGEELDVIGIVVAFAESGTVPDPLAHAQTVASAAARHGWHVKAEGQPGIAYVEGVGGLLRAMRAAMFDDEDQYSAQQNLAMYRTCGWYIGMELNRFMAKFCRDWAIDPTIPLFVSTRVGGGRMLGWHIPAGAKRLYKKRHSLSPQDHGEPPLGPEIMHSLRYRVNLQGYDPTEDERALISEICCRGQDPQSEIDNWRAQKLNFSTEGVPLTDEQIADMLVWTAWSKAERAKRDAIFLKRKQDHQEHLEGVARLSAERKRSQAARAERERQKAELQREVDRAREESMRNDRLPAIMDSWKMGKRGNASEQVEATVRLISSLLDVLKRRD